MRDTWDLTTAQLREILVCTDSVSITRPNRPTVTTSYELDGDKSELMDCAVITIEADMVCKSDRTTLRDDVFIFLNSKFGDTLGVRHADAAWEYILCEPNLCTFSFKSENHAVLFKMFFG